MSIAPADRIVTVEQSMDHFWLPQWTLPSSIYHLYFDPFAGIFCLFAFRAYSRPRAFSLPNQPFYKWPANLKKTNKININHQEAYVENVWPYRDNFQHLLSRYVAIAIEIVHWEGPFEFLFEFSSWCDTQSAQKFSKINGPIAIRIECSENMFSKLEKREKYFSSVLTDTDRRRHQSTISTLAHISHLPSGTSHRRSVWTAHN